MERLMKNFFERRRRRLCRTGLHVWEEIEEKPVGITGLRMWLSRCIHCGWWMVENEGYPDDPFRTYEPDSMQFK